MTLAFMASLPNLAHVRWEPTTITVQTRTSGPCTIDAATHPTLPGVALHPRVEGEGRPSLSHLTFTQVSTGLCILECLRVRVRDPQRLDAIVHALASGCDWTITPADDIARLALQHAARRAALVADSEPAVPA